jgi:hypothetical protein
MFRFLFANLTHVRFAFPGRVLARSAARVMSLAAITALGLGALSAPAAAQTPTPLNIRIAQLHCLDETDDGRFSNSDEPYLVMFTANAQIPVLAGLDAYGDLFGDVDTGETREIGSVLASLFNSDDERLVLVALLESDDSGNRRRIQTKLRDRMNASLLKLKAVRSGRDFLAQSLGRLMQQILDENRGNDEQIGGVQDLVWGQYAIDQAKAGALVRKRLTFVGHDGKYEVRFELSQ